MAKKARAHDVVIGGNDPNSRRLLVGAGLSGTAGSFTSMLWGELLRARSAIVIDIGETSASVSELRLKSSSRPANERPPQWTPVAKGVAQAIWLLWRGDTQTVWDIYLRWSLEPDLEEAARAIVSIGLTSGDLSAGDATAYLEPWIAGEDDAKRKAAVAALPELVEHLPVERAISVAARWRARFGADAPTAFGDAVRRLAQRDTYPMLPALIRLARQARGQADDTVAAVVASAGPAPTEGDPAKRVLERLRILRVVVRSKRAKHLLALKIGEVEKLSNQARERKRRPTHGQSARSKLRERSVS